MAHTNRIAHEQDRLTLQDRAQRLGIYALYGGGIDSKGHGFWMYYAPEAFFERNAATRGWTHMDDVSPSIRNDGRHSGNPHFWMYRDADRLLSSFEGR